MTPTTHLDRRGWITVGLSLLLFAAVMAVQFAIPPDGDNTQAPSIKMAGQVGTTLHMREGDFTVTGVSVAHAVAAKEGLSTKKYTTAGVWLLVGYSFEARRQKSSMQVALMTAGNVEYGVSRRFTLGNDNLIAEEPGFPVRGTFAIELPPAALPGAVLTAGNEALYGAPLNDSQAVVDLGIDQDRADRLVAKAPAVVTVRSS